MKLHREFDRVVLHLLRFHSVFHTLWRVGRPVFDDSVPTAAIKFDREGNALLFVFNEEFWNSLDDYTRAFIICHECLHIILNHSARAKGMDPEIANIAMDVAVNHSLVNNFGFNRESVTDANNYCWVDTVFDRPVPESMSFEQYYMMLVNNEPPSVTLVDQHFDDEGESHAGGKDFEDLICGELSDRLQQRELDTLRSKVRDGAFPGGAGSPGDPLIPGTSSHTFTSSSVTRHFWDKMLEKINDAVQYELRPQFVFKQRRLSLLSPDFAMPHEHEVEKLLHTKLPLYLYLDCSGSCYHEKNRFFDLAMTIDQKTYAIELFSRTTIVEKMQRLDNGKYISTATDGSDDFSAIERHIQECLKNGTVKQHPIVIHLTDGFDCSRYVVQPSRPDLWFWLITDRGTTRAIPRSCQNIYQMTETGLVKIERNC